MAWRIDLALRRQDQVLDDDAWYQTVRADFSQRRPRTLTRGQPSTPAEVLLRWFCRRYGQRTPDDTTLIHWVQTQRLETLPRLVECTAELARQAKVTRGRKRRLDGTCVQTEIHHLTDSGRYSGQRARAPPAGAATLPLVPVDGAARGPGHPSAAVLLWRGQRS
jgi:IS5 family transposase